MMEEQLKPDVSWKAQVKVKVKAGCCQERWNRKGSLDRLRAAGLRRTTKGAETFQARTT